MPALITTIKNRGGRACPACGKRHPNRYVVRVPVGEGANGRITRKGKTVCTRVEAEALVAELKTAKNDRTAVPASKLTVARFVDDWLASIAHKRRRTLEDYAHVMRVYVKPTLGERRLQSITSAEVLGMLRRLWLPKTEGGRGLSPRTIQKVKTVLHTALAYAVRQKLLPSNPATLHKDDMPRPVWTERTILDDDNAARFIAGLAGHPKEALFLTLMLTGMRISEVLGLRWGDLQGNRLSVMRTLDRYKDFQPTKTKRSRRPVPLPKRLLTALDRHKRDQARDRLRAGSAWHDSDLIFCDAIGRPLRQDSLRKPFKTILKKAGLPDMRPHDLRHTQASVQFAEGVSVNTVQARMGHSSAMLTLDTYAHLLPTGQEAAVKALDDWLDRILS